MSSEICFIEARPRVIATGAESVVRLAGGGTETAYYRGGEHYRAGVVAMPRFRAAFGFDDNGWTGGTVPTNGELGFMPGDTTLIETLSALYWRDASILIDAGDELGALARRLTGTIAGVANNEGQLAFAITDPGKLLDKPILGTGFAGTGGIEGPAEAAGREKRRSWGQLFNIPGRLLDKVNNIYEFGDPSKPWQAFDALRDMGRAGTITVLAWQGSIAATFAALQAAAAPAGGGVVAPSIACAKWWTQPAGPLTADIRGETAGGYADTAVAIAARMLTAVAGPAIDDQAAADALRTATVGLHIASTSDTVAQAIDRLFLGVSLFWVLQPDGTIRVGEWAWKAPVASFEAQFIGRERQLPPVKSRKLGYRRNHQIHQASEISVAILDAVKVSASRNTVSVDAAGALIDTAAIELKAVRQNTADLTYWEVKDQAGNIHGSGTGAVTGLTGTGDSRAISAADARDIILWARTHGSPAVPTATSMTITASIAGGAILDQVSISLVKDGANGVPGAAGAPGAPGAPGANGTTFYTWYAYADADNGSFNFTTGAPGDRVYQGIATGKTTAVESTNPADYAWSPYAGPPNFGLAVKANAILAGNKLISTPAVAGWNGSIHSTESFKGGASVSFVVDNLGGFMVGLNTDPTTDASYTSLDFAIYIAGGSTVQVYQSNSMVHDMGAPASIGDVFTVTYNGKSVVYSKNGVAFFTNSSPTPNLTLFLDTSFNSGDYYFGRILAFAAVGQPGRDAVAIRSDTTPAGTFFDNDMWYQPTPKKLWQWNSGAWTQVLGDIASINAILAAHFATDQGVDLPAIVPGALNTSATATQGSAINLPVVLNAPNTGTAIVVATPAITINNAGDTIFVNGSVVITAGSNRAFILLETSPDNTNWTTVQEVTPSTQQQAPAGTYSFSIEFPNPGVGSLYFRMKAFQQAAQSLGDGTAGTNWTITSGSIRVRRFFSK